MEYYLALFNVTAFLAGSVLAWANFFTAPSTALARVYSAYVRMQIVYLVVAALGSAATFHWLVRLILIAAKGGG